MVESLMLIRAVYSKALDTEDMDEMREWLRTFMEPEDVAIVEKNKRGNDKKN